MLIAALKAALRAGIAVSDEEIQAYYDEERGRFMDEDGDPSPLAEVYERIPALLRLDNGEARWRAWLAQARQLARMVITL